MLLARLSLTLSFYSRAHCAPRGTAHLSFSARHVRPLVSEANESIQKPPRVLLIIGCAFGPRKASKVEKPSSRGVSSLHRWSLCFYQFSGPCPCALSAHMYVCLLLCVYSALGRRHTTAPSPELGPMTQTDLSASMWLHINIAKQTNK